MIQQLHKRTRALLNEAHRPRTRANYQSQFKLFLAFAVFLDIHEIQNQDFIMCFLTFLHDNGLSSQTISGYLAAIKNAFSYYNLNSEVLQAKSLVLLLKSFTINAPLKIKHTGIIDIQMLKCISRACDLLPFSCMYRSIFLLAYYSFVRISNFAPMAANQFDSSRHMTRGDMVWGAPGGHLILKWAKNMQNRSAHQVIQIPLVADQIICPVTALQQYFRLYPAEYAHPMFLYPSTKLPVIQSKIRQALAFITDKLGYAPGFITFHSFRRSGATFAFNHHAPFENIQAHGGWKSQAIWAYLNQAHAAAGVVANTFQQHIS